MSKQEAGGFHSLRDPYWTASDYLRLADHEGSAVRYWAVRRFGDLDLDVPVELLRRRLGDEDRVVAGATAMLIGRRKIPALADALLDRLGRGEDAAMGACAVALAGMGDRRVLEFLRRQCRRGPLEADPAVWLALSTLKGPEATRMLQEAFEQVPARGSAPLALLIAEAFVGSDPQAAIPLVVDRWLSCADGEAADTMLAALLAAAGFPGGVGGLREGMRPDQESAWPGLPEALLASLSQHVPLRLTGDASRSARKGRWARLVEELLPIADWLEAEAGAPAVSGRALSLARALAARSRRLGGAPEKARDASRLMLLNLIRLSQTVRARTLALPDAPEDRLRWLLSDAAVPWPDGAASVLEHLAAEAPPEPWVAACVRAVERRTEQAAVAAELLGAWRAEAAVAALAGALGDREDPDLAEAAGDALAEIGEAAVDAVLARLRSAEDPVLIEGCLNVCESLPSQRVVAAIGRRFEDLFIHAPEPLLQTARILGARELLAPLGRELREGEVAAEQAFAFLCQLHRIPDPRLDGISRRLNERLRRVEAPEGEPGPEAEPSLDAALRCNGCRRTYTYAVREICVDPEAQESEGFQPFIRDRIRCKGCGRENDYSLPEKTQLLLLSELALLTERSATEGPEVFDASPFLFVRLGLSDGRRLQPREARRDYEERLARRPDDPELLVGYANVLRLLGEVELAEASLRRVLELDPAAADAYATLGQFAEERGDLAAAEAMYRQVLALGRKARFYRVKDRRDFLERVEEALVRIQGARAVRPPEPLSAQARLQALVAPDRGAAKVGRNDPCPCGSGKKYKKCCLPRAEAASEGRVPEAADERLRQRLAAYVGASLPEAEMQRALREFFGERFDGGRRGPALGAPEVEGEWAAFLEWLIHDFRLPAGQTPIARFLAERGRSLPAEERAILEEWQDAAVGLHEVVDLEPGRSLTLRDVFTGERLTVREVRGSLSAARWDLIGARVIRVHGEPFLSGVVTAFHAPDREELVAHVQGRYQAHCRDHPGATWREFFRAEPLVLHRYAERLAREARPPRLVTSEGHPVMLGRLRYDVRDSRRLLKALAAAPDFEETTEPGGPGDTRSFAWVRSGPAQRYVKTAAPPEGSITLASQRLEADGTERAPGLASLTLEGRGLTVEALSAERLAWAKTRLVELAGDALGLRADVVEDPMRRIEAMRGPESPEAEAPDIPPEIQTRLIGQMLHKHYTAWLDLPIPALDNRTPRQAARDVVLRPRLVQLLREIENHQDRERQRGKPWYDAAWMWEALGIPRTEA